MIYTCMTMQCILRLAYYISLKLYSSPKVKKLPLFMFPLFMLKLHQGLWSTMAATMSITDIWHQADHSHISVHQYGFFINLWSSHLRMISLATDIRDGQWSSHSCTSFITLCICYPKWVKTTFLFLQCIANKRTKIQLLMWCLAQELLHSCTSCM